MKKKLFFIVMFGLLLASCTDEGSGIINAELASSSSVSSSSSSSSSSLGPIEIFPFTENAVSVYGALKACTNDAGKGRLCGTKGDWDGKPVQVRGISLGWTNTGWESAKFYTEAAVNSMVDDWKAQVIRAAMGTGNAYPRDISNWTRAKTVVDAAIAKDVYVIIDWHSHNAQNELAASTDFFTEVVKEYHNNPHVIFEIYNEPLNIPWATIKTYADAVVSAVREAGADNLILVGTRSWSQRPHDAIGNEVIDSKDNIGYVFHFYSQTHRVSAFGSNITRAIDAGLPVFVTEYGTTNSDGGCSTVISDCNGDASGKGTNNYNTHDAKESDNWHYFMDAHNISSVAWNFNNKYEGSSFFGVKSDASNLPSSFNDKSLMNESGKYIFDKLNAYAD